MPELTRLGPRSLGWPRAARVSQPGPGRGGGAGWGSPKCSQIRSTGKRWCSYCPWDTEARPVPSSAVPCGGPARLAAPVPPARDRGRGEEKPCPLAAAAGTGPARVRPAGPGIYLRPRHCPPPEAALRAPSPPIRVLGPARHLRPGTGRRGRVRDNRRLLGTRKGRKRQAAAAPACGRGATARGGPAGGRGVS